ncbi:hypothetical protein CK203_114052 [Vitis vinifera]|uniref:Uncharacterized protein n=1 Tax=Vitis vinifera TaxID=29760 RepID=A0A438CPA9_VITVI|nr:hypothetical protein CK203_114052 [Vitis vinifera]
MAVQLASGSVASQWQLARTLGDQVKQPIDLQLAEEMMACASGWHVQATIWVVGGYARQLWAVLASCITTSWEGRLAKDESLALRTREKFNEIFRDVTIGIRARTRDGWW